MIEFSRSSDFDFLSAEYAKLFSRSAASAFQHPLWLDRLYSRLTPKLGRAPVIVVGRNESNGRLVFVLPMIKRDCGPLRIVESADMGVNDYCLPVVDRDVVAMMAKNPSLQRRAAKCLGSMTVSRLQKVRADSLDQVAVFGGARPTFMGLHAHPILLDAPFPAWRAATLSQSFRRFLDRKRRLLEKKTSGLQLEELTSPEAIEDAFASLRAFREQRWTEDLLNKEPFFDFYVDVARAGQASGLTRTYLFSCDGEPVGVFFGLAHRGEFLLVLTGFNINAFRNYSLGLLMLENAIEHCIERGDTVFDMTIGDEPYKADFGTTKIPMLSCWMGPQPIPSLTRLAFGCLIRFRSLQASAPASICVAIGGA